MPRARVATGMELEYDTFGSPDDPALLLVMGFTSQMIDWDEEFCRMLADSGLHVVRFDNRDCGLSTKFEGPEVDVAALVAAVFSDADMPPVPYTLSDMAADAVGLLDVLGIERAHVVGASMGGMIAQVMAIEHPHRCRSLVSVMSTVAFPQVGPPTPEVFTSLLQPAPSGREAYIESSANWLLWASKKFGDAERAASRAAISYDRSFYPDGGPRQAAAIIAAGDRSDALAQLDLPTLVIHGRDDTFITPPGGFRTAEVIPGAHLLYLADMGHDMPMQLWPTLVDAIVSHTRLS